MGIWYRASKSSHTTGTTFLYIATIRVHLSPAVYVLTIVYAPLLTKPIIWNARPAVCMSKALINPLTPSLPALQ